MENIHEKQVGFREFADYLFLQPTAPPERSIVLNLELENDQQCTTSDFLYELFVHGYRLKYGDVGNSELSEKHFESIRSYIRALGFDAYLLGYTKNENDEVTHVQLGFSTLQ